MKFIFEDLETKDAVIPHIKRDIEGLPDRQKVQVLKKIDYFEKKDIIQMLRTKDLEKQEGLKCSIYELKIKVSIQYRLLGLFNLAHKFHPLASIVKKRGDIPEKLKKLAYKRAAFVPHKCKNINHVNTKLY